MISGAVVIGAVRTPIGRRNGVLRHWHPVDLVAEVVGGLVQRADVDPAVVEEVIVGCVTQIGEQSVNLARNAALAAGWPDHVPGTTVDRQTTAGQHAVHLAVQGLLAGSYDVAVAAGVEMMSRVPTGAAMGDGKFGYPFGPRLTARYAPAGGLVPPGVAAELIADEWQLSRVELDEYAVRSQERAWRAVRAGRFSDEIVPVVGAGGALVTADDGVGPAAPEALAGLAPSFRAEADGGRITAGNSSRIADGAAALLLMSAAAASTRRVRPLARIVGLAGAAGDPRLMFTAGASATRTVLERTGLDLADIGVIEVHESSAAAVLAWERELGADPERVNVNGGALALGDPLGCAGGRELITLVHELARRGRGLGLLVTAGGGVADALVIESMSTADG
jgi:acetyl-CoA acyltransferase